MLTFTPAHRCTWHELILALSLLEGMAEGNLKYLGRTTLSARLLCLICGHAHTLSYTWWLCEACHLAGQVDQESQPHPYPWDPHVPPHHPPPAAQVTIHKLSQQYWRLDC